MESLNIFSYKAQTEAHKVAKDLERYCVDKHVVITGASVGGMGFEAARVLAMCGAEVTLCCRTQESAEEAVRVLQEQQHDAKVFALVVDLASFLSIHRCVEALLLRGRAIDVLIHAAAVFTVKPRLTVDGFEAQWQVNFLSPLLFTQLALPLLRAAGTREIPARVVCVSASANLVFTPDRGLDLTQTHTETHTQAHTQEECAPEKTQPSNAIERFGESKLALILFARELTRRERALSDACVVAVSMHPGYVPETRFRREVSIADTLLHCPQLILKRAFNKTWRKEKPKTICQGAATMVFCALHPNISAGRHYADCGESDLVHAQAHSERCCERLWDVAEQQIMQRLAALGAVCDKVQELLDTQHEEK